ncbi:MAG: Uma2 family endonuclease [Peptococcaceae bacterium]|nr:Uma2 family endonuclease [Peptococcaceae bacterium]
MIVDLNDLKNNLDKYIRLSAMEEIIITRDGVKVARLSAYEEEKGPGGAAVIREQGSIYEVTPRRASYEDFLELTETSEERYEYIDGEIYLLSSPRSYHQETLGELHGIFYIWFRGKKCRPMLAPYDITLKRNADDINVVQPDLMVICDLKEKLNEKDYYMGVPVLVVEIISESTRSKDFIKKLNLYMSTGVKEYWIVDPLIREVHVYLLEDGEIRKSTVYKDHQAAVSDHFAGLEVDLDMIFL